MEQHEIERIAIAALKDLGVSAAEVTVAAVEGRPGHWAVDIRGSRASRLKIRCSEGSTPQWVRNQVLEQYQSQH